MDKPIFEAGKEYRTRDGRLARVYATNGGEGGEIIGAYLSLGYGWYSASWDALGQNVCGTDLDLMPPEPEKEFREIDVYMHTTHTKPVRVYVTVDPDGTLKLVR